MPMNNEATAVVESVHDAPLTERVAASRLGLKVSTLRAWRGQGRGPAYVRLGRAVRYLPSDLQEFLRANRRDLGNVVNQ
jgi:hypothetical protein